jgi:hypothetical protein
MKTRTLSGRHSFVEVVAAVWDLILGLGQWMDDKEAELDRKSFREQMVIIVPISLASVYFGLGFIRCIAVLQFGAKAIPDMAIDWWWVALVRLIS